MIRPPRRAGHPHEGEEDEEAERGGFHRPRETSSAGQFLHKDEEDEERIHRNLLVQRVISVKALELESPKGSPIV